MVGLIPLFAVEVLEDRVLARLPGFRKRMQWFLDNRQDLANHISYMATQADVQLKARIADYDYSSFFYSSSDDVFTIHHGWLDKYATQRRVEYNLAIHNGVIGNTTRESKIGKTGFIV